MLDGLRLFLDNPGRLVVAASKGIIVGSLLGAAALPVLVAGAGLDPLTIALAQLVGGMGSGFIGKRVQTVFDRWHGQHQRPPDHEEFARLIEDEAQHDPQFAAYLVQLVDSLDLPAQAKALPADDFATVYAAMQREIGALQARLDDTGRATAERVLAGFKPQFDTLIAANQITHAKLDQIIAMQRAQAQAAAERNRVVQHPIPDVSRVVGRTVQLQELRDRLRHDARLAIVGVAGVGKTTLAAMYCTDRNLRGNYQAVCWFEMKGQPLVSDLARQFGALLGRQPSEQAKSEEDYAHQLLEWLRDLNGPHLIVLNNAETVLDENSNATGGWATLLGEARLGGNRLLLTSRQQVRAGGEVLPGYNLAGLSEDEAVALLTTRGVAASDGQLREAARKCECHTYALIFLAQLVAGGRKLARLLQSKALWQGEIAANLLDEVYRGLDGGQQALLRYVSVYDVPDLLRQPVSAAELAAMLRELDAPLRPTPTEDWDADGVDALGLALTRRSLLEYSAEERYTIHAIVRDYAYKQLPDPAAHHRAAAASFRRQYTTTHPDPHTKPAKDSAEVQPLLDGFDQLCAAGEYQQAAALLNTPLEYLSGDPVNLKNLLRRWSEFSRLQTMLERLVNAPTALEDSSRATVMGNLGGVYYALSEYDKASEYLTRSLELAQQLGDHEVQALSLNSLGNVYRALGLYDKAIEYYTRSLELAQQIGDRLRQERNLNNLGVVYHALGEYDKAIEYLTRSLELAQQLGDREVQAHSLANLGNVNCELGEYDKAIEYLTRSLELKQQLGDRWSQTYSLDSLGNAYHALGEYDKASEYLTRSLELAQQLGDRQGQALSLDSLGNVYRELGEYDKAIEYLTRSLELAQQLGSRQVQAQSFRNLGLVYDGLGEYDKAVSYLQQARAIFVSLGLAHEVVKADKIIARVQQAASGGLGKR